MNKVLLSFVFFLAFLTNLQACEFYLERKDVAELGNLGLDLWDEYEVEKKILLTNQKILKKINQKITKIKFSNSSEINKIIYHHFKTYHKSQIKLHPIKSQKHPLRQGFLVIEPFYDDLYYSFILYFNSDCSLK